MVSGILNLSSTVLNQPCCPTYTLIIFTYFHLHVFIIYWFCAIIIPTFGLNKFLSNFISLNFHVTASRVTALENSTDIGILCSAAHQQYLCRNTHVGKTDVAELHSTTWSFGLKRATFTPLTMTDVGVSQHLWFPHQRSAFPCSSKLGWSTLCWTLRNCIIKCYQRVTTSLEAILAHHHPQSLQCHITGWHSSKFLTLEVKNFPSTCFSSHWPHSMSTVLQYKSLHAFLCLWYQTEPVTGSPGPAGCPAQAQPAPPPRSGPGIALRPRAAASRDGPLLPGTDRTRGHSPGLCKGSFISDVRRNFFTERVIRYGKWAAQGSCGGLPSLELCKNKLDVALAMV